MNFILAAPVYILMLFQYDFNGINYATSYVMRDQNLCQLAAQTRFVSQTGRTGFCVKASAIDEVMYQCSGDHITTIETRDKCLSKLPDDLVLGPFGVVMYGLNKK